MYMYMYLYLCLTTLYILYILLLLFFLSLLLFTHSGGSLHASHLVDALRHFLESFRLPGESPIISRILETFTEHWLVRQS